MLVCVNVHTYKYVRMIRERTCEIMWFIQSAIVQCIHKCTSKHACINTSCNVRVSLRILRPLCMNPRQLDLKVRSHGVLAIHHAANLSHASQPPAPTITSFAVNHHTYIFPHIRTFISILTSTPTHVYAFARMRADRHEHTHPHTQANTLHTNIHAHAQTSLHIP